MTSNGGVESCAGNAMASASPAFTLAATGFQLSRGACHRAASAFHLSSTETAASRPLRTSHIPVANVYPFTISTI